MSTRQGSASKEVKVDRSAAERSKCSRRPLLLGMSLGLAGWIALHVSLAFSLWFGHREEVSRSFAGVLLDPGGFILAPMSLAVEPVWLVPYLMPAVLGAFCATRFLKAKSLGCMFYGVAVGAALPVIGMFLLVISAVAHGG